MMTKSYQKPGKLEATALDPVALFHSAIIFQCKTNMVFLIVTRQFLKLLIVKNRLM